MLQSRSARADIDGMLDIVYCGSGLMLIVIGISQPKSSSLNVDPVMTGWIFEVFTVCVFIVNFWICAIVAMSGKVHQFVLG